jgi:hypothetical protein
MMNAHGCMGVVFVSKFDFFLQQKLIIIVLELQSHDWEREIFRGLGLKANNKIYNVQHNIGLILVFNG